MIDPATLIDPANATVQAFVRLHKNQIFPKLFQQLTFDMVAEIEFDIEKKGKVFFLTSSNFWMTPDRQEKGHFQIVFQDTDAKTFGKLVHPGMVNAVQKRNASFKVGYTQNLANVDKPEYKQLVSAPMGIDASYEY